MKTTFPKAQPKIVYYRDYKDFDLYNFRTDLREELNKIAEKDYFHFKLTFLRVLEMPDQCLRLTQMCVSLQTNKGKA